MPASAGATASIEILLHEQDWARHLAETTLAGLSDSPPWTPPVWFYDERGSELFDRITRLPEYYPTRSERAILQANAGAIAELSGAATLVELGAGSADKTRLLLSALAARGTLRRFVPVDCSQPALAAAAEQVGAEFPGLAIHSIVADFTAHLPLLPRGPSRMVAFLGSTIGNFSDQDRSGFLGDVAAHLGPDDTYLLGTDLVKSPERLVAAYDDPSGVTAAFNLNSLAVMNRQLGSDFDVTAFDHRAVWNSEDSRIEMHVVARDTQVVTFSGLGGHAVRFARGDWLRTEISVKFTPDRVARELAAVGLRPLGQWTDPAGDFLLTLARPVRPGGLQL